MWQRTICVLFLISSQRKGKQAVSVTQQEDLLSAYELISTRFSGL